MFACSQDEYEPIRKMVDLSFKKKFYSKHVGSVYIAYVPYIFWAEIIHNSARVD